MNLFEKPSEIGEYIFRITDNGGLSADRYTIMYSDGTYHCSSSNPNHPQGIFMSGEGFDPAWAQESVESGKEIDLRWVDLPVEVQGAVFASLNQAFSDWLKSFAPPISREEAAEHGSGDLMSRAGEGIYGVDGNYRIRIEAYPDDESEKDDRGPYATLREALLDTLPDHYDVSGPEYHSTVNIWDQGGLGMKFFNILIPYCCTVLVRVPAEKIDSEDEAFELAIGHLDKLEPTLQLMATEGPIDEEILSVLDGRYTKSVIYYDSCRRLSQKIGWSDNHSSVAELRRDCDPDLVPMVPMTGAQECATRLLDEHTKDMISLVETWQQRVDVMKSAHTLEVDALHEKLLDREVSRPQTGSPLVIQFEAGRAELRACSVIYSDSGRILEVVDGEYRRDGSRYKNARFLGVYKTTVAEYRRLIHEFGERK